MSLGTKFLSSALEHSFDEENYSYPRQSPIVRKSLDDLNGGLPAKSVQLIFNLVERLLTLHDANPNDQKRFSCYQNLFLENNSLTKLKEYIDYLSENAANNNPILLLGPRGSGKSTVQNKLFTNDNDFLESKNLIFVRCDAHKLYKIWEEHGQSVESGSLVHYLDFQTLYVLAKYGLKSKNVELKTMLENSLDTEMELWVNRSEGYFSAASSFGDRLEEVRREIRTEDPKDRSQSAMIRAFKTGFTRFKVDYQQWRLLANHIKKYVHDHNWKFLYVVDGVDNILWHHENKAASYGKMVKELESFASLTLIEDIKLISLRDETMISDIATDASNNTPIGIANAHEVKHEPPSLKEVLDHKIKHLRDPAALLDMFGSDYVASRKVTEDEYLGIVSLIEEAAKIFHEENETYIKEIGKNYLTDFEKAQYDTLSLQDRVSNYYHHNVRAYSFNFLSFLRKDLGTHLSGRSRTGFLERTVYRNLFLDGREFLRTNPNQDGTERKGTVFPNVFWSQIDGENWDGLALFRVFQYLRSSQVPVEPAVVSGTVGHYLNYSKEALDRAIKIGTAFGLFSYTPDEFSPTPTYQLYVTDKGRLCFWLTFSRLDMLYYMCLDTPLYRSAITKLQIHTDKNSGRSFLESCLRSSRPMLHLIGRQDFRDSAEFRRDKVVPEDYKGTIHSTDELAQIFGSPFQNKNIELLKNSIQGMAFRFKQENVQRYRSLLKEIAVENCGKKFTNLRGI